MGIFLFALALGIRLAGIGWGLPHTGQWYSLHPDETVVWAYSQQIEPARLDFDPGFYNYGTLYLTLLRVATDVVVAYGGAPPTGDEGAAMAAIARYHLAGRVISAVAGAATVWLVFAIARRRIALPWAVIGALAMAFAPGHVMHSRFQTVDVIAACFFAAALWAALRLGDALGEGDPGTRHALLAGLFAGLAAGVKYSGVVVLVSVAVMAAGNGCRGLKALGLSALVAAASFVVVTPGVFKNPSAFYRDLRYEMAHVSEGHGLIFAETTSGFVYHLGNLSAGFGTVMLFAGLAGLAWGTIVRSRWILAAAASFLVVYAIIGRAEVKFFRYALPLVPVLALGVAVLAERLHGHPRPAMRLANGVVILGLGGAIAACLVQTGWMIGPDPRQQAATFLRGQGAVDGALVSDPWYYTPILYPQTAAPRSVPFVQRDAWMRAAREPRVERYVPGNPDERYDWDVRVLDERPQWVVYSSFEFDDLMRIKDRPVKDPVIRVQVDRFRSFVERLRSEYRLELVYGLQGPTIHDLQYPRPRIWLWKRKANSTNRSSGSSIISEWSAAVVPTRSLPTRSIFDKRSKSSRRSRSNAGRTSQPSTCSVTSRALGPRSRQLRPGASSPVSGRFSSTCGEGGLGYR
jgi:hypothetical protein